MNFGIALSDTAKLITSIVGLVFVGVVLWWASTFLTAKKQLAEIRTTDARIERSAKAANVKAKARDNAADTFTAANQQQAAALAKALDHATPENDFDDALRADYFRVLNDALRGAQR